MSQDAIIRVGDDGRFRRKRSEFRDAITADGSSGFPAVAGRYHIYAAWACPWAHRTLLHRRLLGLEDAISFSTVEWLMRDDGAWTFSRDGQHRDPLYEADDLQDIYKRADPGFPAIGTVPVLWDKEKETVVNNESREIVRMLDTQFAALQTNDVTFLPAGLEREVDAMIDANYETVNNAVYKAGFARSQEAYDEAIEVLFDRLAELDDLLAGQRYLCGDQITEADWLLFVTLIRFDLVYQYHFKCNLRRIQDHPNLWGHTLELYQVPGVKETMDLEETKKHYEGSHTSINPYRIIWAGPELDLDRPHGRDERFPVKDRFARRDASA